MTVTARDRALVELIRLELPSDATPFEEGTLMVDQIFQNPPPLDGRGSGSYPRSSHSAFSLSGINFYGGHWHIFGHTKKNFFLLNFGISETFYMIDRN